jgi:Lrp/AsnC family leucine-responsive transcriptional regulator
MSLDRIDRHILMLLQTRGRISTSDLSELVGLSASPCARRLKRLEDEGFIDGYQARINEQKAGISMKFFVEISLSRHQVDSIEEFEKAVVEFEEVVNCHIVSGGYDYLLEVVSKDLESYELFTRKLHRLENIKDIQTHLSIRQVNNRTVVPIYS